MKNLIFAAIFLTSVIAQAEVWPSGKDWGQEDENKFSEWMKTVVTADLFSSVESKYFGIKTDCADAAMALRILYAYEQKLPVRLKTANGSYLTNFTSEFDSMKEGMERVRAFIALAGESIGSEDLAELNSYPIRLAELRAGDFYVTRYKNQFGDISRHVYIVKGFADNGDLILYSSTQPRAIRPLQVRIGIPSHFFENAPFGFRRFNSAPELKKSEMSSEQYEDMKKGENFYFNKIKETHKKIEDTFEINITHRLQNICFGLETRKEVVAYTQYFRNKTGLRCMSRSEYDEHSTISRDHNIAFDIERLTYGYKTMVKQGKDKEISTELKSAMDYLSGVDISSVGEESLNGYCKINLSESASMSVRAFYERYKQGLISFDPNQNADVRWGLAPEVIQCNRF